MKPLALLKILRSPTNEPAEKFLMKSDLIGFTRFSRGRGQLIWVRASYFGITHRFSKFFLLQKMGLWIRVSEKDQTDGGLGNIQGVFFNCPPLKNVNVGTRMIHV